MRIALLGLGIVGSALHKYLVKRDHDCLRYDPPKRLHQRPDAICKAAFVAVPVNMSGKRGSDFSFQKDETALIESIELVPDHVPIFIRSTLLPGTTNRLQARYPKKTIAHMPEFLTERTATKDFEESTAVVVGGDSKIGEHATTLDALFGDEKRIHYVPAYSAELGKQMHNYLGSVRVHVSNLFMEAATVATRELNKGKSPLSHFHPSEIYSGIKTTALSSGNHNDQYFAVPGPDGKRGFGGKCFTKDMECVKEFFTNHFCISEAAFTEMVLKMNETYRTGGGYV